MTPGTLLAYFSFALWLCAMVWFGAWAVPHVRSCLRQRVRWHDDDEALRDAIAREKAAYPLKRRP